MAKAKEIVGLDCAGNAFEGVIKVLRVRFDEVIGYRQGALDFSDVKGVHSMRVATRRLRSALRDFAPLLKKLELKEVKTDLKTLADALGAVRDRDVEIMAIEKLQGAAETETIKTGLEDFLQKRRRTRETAQSDLTKRLADEKIEDLKQQFTDTIDKAADSDKGGQTVSFKDFGREIIKADLEEFCDLSAAVYEPFNIDGLHKLRISAKRLRYAMQLFASCWDREMKAFAKEISKMQSFLGNVHDYDVWIESLSKELQASGATQTGDLQTAVWLLSEMIAQRTKEYNSALKLWHDWQVNYFIPRLKALIL